MAYLNTKRFGLVWEWPRDQMAWFLWNWGGMYRLGPVTVHIYKREING